MTKYSYEFKKEIVTAYLSGEGSYIHLAKKYDIPDEHIIRLWLNNYKSFGFRFASRSCITFICKS